MLLANKRVDIFLSEYAFVVALRQVAQKLCVENKWITPLVNPSSLYAIPKVTLSISTSFPKIEQR